MIFHVLRLSGKDPPYGAQRGQVIRSLWPMLKFGGCKYLLQGVVPICGEEQPTSRAHLHPGTVVPGRNQYCRSLHLQTR
jgi:hypothetical protein